MRKLSDALVALALAVGLIGMGVAFIPAQTAPLTNVTVPLSSSGFATLSPAGAQTGNLNITGSVTAASETLSGAGTALTVTNSVSAGKILLPTGANATAGTATLVAGTVTVSTTAVTASSIIVATTHTPGGTGGFMTVPTRTAGTSFVITSSNAADTSTVDWIIVN